MVQAERIESTASDIRKNRPKSYFFNQNHPFHISLESTDAEIPARRGSGSLNPERVQPPRSPPMPPRLPPTFVGYRDGRCFLAPMRRSSGNTPVSRASFGGGRFSVAIDTYEAQWVEFDSPAQVENGTCCLLPLGARRGTHSVRISRCRLRISPKA